MKILLLTTHLNLGGIGVYVQSLAKGLVHRGHQVFVVSCGGDLVASLESCRATHFTVDLKTKSELSPKLICAQGKIAQIVRENGIEIIHAHTRISQVLAHWLAKQTARPYVTTCHGFFKPRLFRIIFPCWGARCVAISEAVREHLVNDLGLSKDKVSVVHNGVEINKFSPERFTRRQKEILKNNYGLKEGPIIGTVARLSAVKGQRYLIAAMQTILQSYPQAQLLLVGDGPEKQRLLNQVSQLGMENRIFFTPPTLDTSAPLSIMDAFIFPSLSEGLGLAIIEAQAMGLPVVASNVGGIYTLVKDGVNGFLVHPQEPGALAEAILKLLDNKELARQFARRAIRQAREEFSLQQMCIGIEKIYQEALKK